MRTSSGRRRADGSRAVGFRDGYVPSQLAKDCYAVLADNPNLRPMGVRSVGYVLKGWPQYAARIAADTDLGHNGKYRHMDRVKDALIDARRGRFIPFDWVDDGSEVAAEPNEYDGLTDWLGVLRRSAQDLRLRRQAGQAQFIEVWTESRETVGIIERVAHEYGVPVYSSGGQHHLTGIYDLAQRAEQRTVPTLVLHLGDYDAKGRAIYDRFAEDVQAFHPAVEFVRIGLTPEQIERFGLADGDHELEAMIEHIGAETEAAIRRYIDLTALATSVADEQAAQQAALRFIDGEDAE